MAHWLIIDDEHAIRWGWQRLLRSLGHESTAAESAEQALEFAALRPFDGVALDVRLPGMDGLTALPELFRRLGTVPVVVMTAYGDLETAVQALRSGAFEYLVKPFDLKAAENVVRRAEAWTARQKAPAATRVAGDMLIGRSAPMQQLFKEIALAAESDAAIHLHGETGTGKELVARAIHRYSRRAAGPFVPVHLASLNPSLVESELFGHVRGSFTGAEESRPGLLQQAHGGTVFLDEVAEIPPEIQVKLLRVLEYGELYPVGASNPVRIDFRVVSATHRNLSERVTTGAFRQDLLFRLNTFEIKLPALRERREDIELLVEYFLQQHGQAGRGQAPSIASETYALLQRRPWHGNVRELRNAIEHAIILARGAVILPEHLPEPASPVGAPTADLPGRIRSELEAWAREQWNADDKPQAVYDRLLELVEPPVLQVALQQHQGQLAAAARSLGLHRMTLRKKLRSISRDDASQLNPDE